MDLFELQAVLRLNTEEYDTGLDNAEKKGGGFLDRIANTWVKAKAKFQQVSGMLSPVINIVSDAVDAYGSYQQSLGGIQKLFGTASDTITKNARNAFKSAGMSINDYMDMCIQTGATMLKSVGEDSARAADLMDMAIIDMADNVNALGTDMESVMTAYRGFSRQNFTMLDNLALGYAGTKEGMEALLADAKELSGIEYDIGSYADIVEAIHVIQQSRNITGTSAAESSATIKGSKTYMEAAKQNMLIVLADEKTTQAEREEAAKEYGEAVGAYIKNIIPVIREVLKGLLVAIKEIIPELLDSLPVIINLLVDLLLGILQDPTALQSIIKALVYAFVSAIAGIFDVLLTMLISIFNPDYQMDGTAFSQWGVYDWIRDAFGYGEMTDREGNTVEIESVKQYNAPKRGAKYFMPEELVTNSQEAQDAKLEITSGETLEGAEQLLKLVYGQNKGKQSAYASQDKEGTNTQVSVPGYYDQNFASTGDAIYYVYKLLENEGYDIEKLKAQRDAGIQYDENKVEVWERNGGQVELPKGMTQTVAENLIKAVRYAGELNDEDLSNENVKQILEDFAAVLTQQDYTNLNNAEAQITTNQGVSVSTGEVRFNGSTPTEVILNVGKIVAGATDRATAEAEYEGSHAKGLWSVPYDNYLANLHRDEMVLTASQARDYREGSGDSDTMMDLIQLLRTDMANLKIQVGEKVFGQTVVDYSGRKMRGYIGRAEDRVISGYGWG